MSRHADIAKIWHRCDRFTKRGLKCAFGDPLPQFSPDGDDRGERPPRRGPREVATRSLPPASEPQIGVAVPALNKVFANAQIAQQMNETLEFLGVTQKRSGGLQIPWEAAEVEKVLEPLMRAQPGELPGLATASSTGSFSGEELFLRQAGLLRRNVEQAGNAENAIAQAYEQLAAQYSRTSIPLEPSGEEGLYNEWAAPASAAAVISALEAARRSTGIRRGGPDQGSLRDASRPSNMRTFKAPPVGVTRTGTGGSRGASGGGFHIDFSQRFIGPGRPRKLAISPKRQLTASSGEGFITR